MTKFISFLTSKELLIACGVIGIAILLVISFFIGYKFYKYYQVKNEKKVVELKTEEMNTLNELKSLTQQLK